MSIKGRLTSKQMSSQLDYLAEPDNRANVPGSNIGRLYYPINLQVPNSTLIAHTNTVTGLTPRIPRPPIGKSWPDMVLASRASGCLFGHPNP